MAKLYHIIPTYLILLLPGSLTATLEHVQEPHGRISYRCPGPYILNDPWYPDADDCSCYFVCGIGGDAVRMCCPAGLWWHHETKTCIYFQDYNTNYQEKCQNLARGVGTTKQLREIFLGRCWEYQRYINPAAFQEGYRDCAEMFDSFAKVFVNKAPCNDVKPEDYQDLVEKSHIQLPPDSQVFWSGTYGLAQEYASQGRRGFTLETTMIGYILNDVTWCGATVAPGINFETCPAFASCPNHVMASFWAKALETYASHAEGIVTVLLNGSRVDGPAFRNNSFFAEHELPQLDPERVSKVQVWVAHDLDKPIVESCTSHGSIWILKAIVDELGIPYECEDNPYPVHHLLCAYQPMSPSCQFNKPVRIQSFPPVNSPHKHQPVYEPEQANVIPAQTGYEGPKDKDQFQQDYSQDAGNYIQAQPGFNYAPSNLEPLLAKQSDGKMGGEYTEENNIEGQEMADEVTGEQAMKPPQSASSVQHVHGS